MDNAEEGQMVVSGSNNSRVQLWDTATGYYQRTLEGHSDYASAFAFSQDG